MSARALGMKESEILSQIELPLAQPLLVAGLRSASFAGDSYRHISCLYRQLWAGASALLRPENPQLSANDCRRHTGSGPSFAGRLAARPVPTPH